jgi:hypothetical protein
MHILNRSLLRRALVLSAACLLLPVGARAQKRIFIPDSLKPYDLNSDTSRWCWKHSVQTPDLVFFWEKGFGDDPAKAPQLDGHPMTFDLPNLQKRVQSFYTFFRDTLKFSLPGSKADRYKMMVMINYSLDGTAYGGTYDNFIGALWVAPNRIQDRKLNCLAHELGHSFQLQIPADSVGDAWGGSGFYEMTSQWMLWQVNPDWLTDENYHFEAFKKLTHKAYLDGSNIYHSPYVIEWWAERHGRPFIAELYRNGRVGEDPVLTYQRLTGLSQQQFCQEMFSCYQHLVDLDFSHAFRETRRYACSFSTPMQPAGQKGWYEPKDNLWPEDYGFNAIRLTVPKAGSTVKADVRRLTAAKGSSELLYGFVGVGADGHVVCGQPVGKGKARFRVPQSGVSHLYLIVMGAPSQHKMLTWDAKEPNRNYPYRVSASVPIESSDVAGTTAPAQH